ncbi:DUF5675 family protein [Fulvivirga maritima]|uniref:DUF5675 family protein n=1 Tax=Fulvivirga maritima TaxID=2904247 RepID=UPI001F3F374D|nr:DUF5675 family protein [Fulvivirga maritima]UII25985.1 DUF5675 family protein [Fulvivirga maritima]
MKKLGLLITIALVTLAIIYFIKNPDVFEDIWLWIIGLIGVVKELTSKLLNIGKERVNGKKSVSNKPLDYKVIKGIVEDDFQGLTITLLRYSDDKETTVGLLYLNGQYYCYTLEDTFRSKKIANQTRIPAGTYQVAFRRLETNLTKKYRDRFPDWFDYHLEVQNVPQFTGIYIHNGGTHKDTSGCILVSDSLSVSSKSTYLSNSRETFKRLYLYLKSNIEQGIQVRLVIKDENWFAHLTA